MLTPLQSLSLLLVMASNKSMDICNYCHVKRANSPKK